MDIDQYQYLGYCQQLGYSPKQIYNQFNRSATTEETPSFMTYRLISRLIFFRTDLTERLLALNSLKSQ